MSFLFLLELKAIVKYPVLTDILYEFYFLGLILFLNAAIKLWVVGAVEYKLHWY